MTRIESNDSGQESESTGIITSLDQLKSLRAGSRKPIDISPQTDIIFPVMDSMHSNKPNMNQIARSFSSVSVIEQSEANRKYFSFLTTNKSFLDKSRVTAPAFNNRLENVYAKVPARISENDTSDTLDDVATNRSSFLTTTDDTIHSNRCSDLGTYNSVSDDIYSSSASSTSLDNKVTEESEVKSVGYRKSASYDTQCSYFKPAHRLFHNKASFRIQKNSETIRTRQTPPLTVTSSLKGHRPVNLVNSETKCCSASPKYLIVLLDYDSHAVNPMNKSQTKLMFSVRKGEIVKVLRDYDGKYFLVSASRTGLIGFLPKSYTVDLDEIRSKFQHHIQVQDRPFSCSTEMYIDSF